MPRPGPHRLLGLELRRLARARLPAGLPAAPLARALRDAVRHRRGQLDLLPARPPRGGRALGRADAARLRLRGQGEPLPDAHEAPDRHGARRRAALRRHRAARRVAASSARCCGSSRSTSTATTTGSRFALERLPPGRHCFEFRHPSWFALRGLRPAAHVRRRARDRRRPAPARSSARADAPTGPSSASTTAAAAAAATTPRPSCASGRRGSRELRARGRGLRLLQQRLGGLRGPQRPAPARLAGGLKAPRSAVLVLSGRDAGWSSQVARRAHNPKVAGSNPAPAIRRR